MKAWPLQDAKAQFSQVVKLAQKEGPQTVSVHGEPTAVVLSMIDYRRLSKEKPSFVDLMRSSPFVGVDLKINRPKDSAKRVKL